MNYFCKALLMQKYQSHGMKRYNETKNSESERKEKLAKKSEK